MSIFFILFLLKYFVYKDIECKQIVIKLIDRMHLSLFNLGDTIWPIYYCILCYI